MTSKKNLTLNLKKKYFDEIKNGTKTEEYRLCTPFWKKRIEGKEFENIIIKLGYPKNDQKEKILIFPWKGYEIKEIKHEHFGDTPVRVYAIKIQDWSCKNEVEN